ncbi:MAG: hypothetical protein H8E18_02305, partial [FCB group bacterium]|nr:hypothetical protein [FCB group bacterium]
MSVLLSVMLLCLIIAACEDPAITNPADPNYELSPPTLLTAEAVTDVSIALTWRDNEEHTKEFVISRKGAAGSYAVLATVDKAVLSYTDTTCVLATNYSYVIQSKVETNVSGNSNVIQKGTSFSAPSNLNTVSISDESIRLTWTDNTGYEDGFKIERDEGSGFVQLAGVD